MTHTTPAILRERDREMIPKPLVRMMLGLVLASLALVTFSVVTGRPHAGVPKESAVIAQRELVIQTGGAQAVKLLSADGTLLQELAHGGFVTVIGSGMDRERTVRHITGNPPVLLQRRANGRLSVFDPATGWSVELTVFGSDNEAAFQKLLPAGGA